MAEIARTGNGSGQNQGQGQTDGQKSQGDRTKKGVSGLTVLVTLVSYVGYAIVLYKAQNVEASQKMLAGAIFLFAAPFAVAVGGFVGNLICPQFIITSGAANLVRERMFWWIGPRFIGAAVAGIGATWIAAPALL